MSIATEISRLQSAKADIKTAIEGKGVSVPSSALLDDYADYIELIQGGDGLTNEVKDALLDLARNIAYTTPDAQELYDALFEAFYPVTSISAVFNQGDNVIYDTDSLDDLKQYLTVTAYYDDGTSGTVTGYTLSGTLAEGTSTITVSYNGKTTTFNVAVTQLLPTGYTALKCLTMDGNQYIDPSISETNFYSAEYKVARSQTGTSNGHILSSNNTYYPHLAYSSERNPNNYILSKLKSSVNNTLSLGWLVNTDYTIAFDVSTRKLTVNGSDLGTLSVGTTANASNKYLMFAYNGNSGASTHRFIGKCYYINLYDANGDLVHEYLPARRNSDSVCGMYDTVTNTFLTSATGTNFGGEE